MKTILRWLFSPIRLVELFFTAMRDTRNEMRRGLSCKKCGHSMTSDKCDWCNIPHDVGDRLRETGKIMRHDKEKEHGAYLSLC